MTKQILRLTESDLHKLIRNTVKKVIREAEEGEKKEAWQSAYDKWRESGTEDDNRTFTRELKKAHPDPKERNLASSKYMKRFDSSPAKEFAKKWKESGKEDKFNKEYQAKYGKSVDATDESVISRAVTESLNRFMTEDSKKKVNEAFEDDFNAAREKHLSKSPNSMFGFEMKNPEGDWQYGDITFDPNTNTMSCMGVSIEVDPSLSIDQNLEGLYDELVNKGFGDEDFENDDEEWVNQRIDTEANMDDFPADIH